MKVLKIPFAILAAVCALWAAAAAAQTPPPSTQKPPTTPPPATQKPTTPLTPPPGVANPTPAPKPPAPFPEGAKIAFLNVNYILQTSDEGKAAIAEVRELENKRSGELADKKKKFEEAQKKANDAANVMSEQARAQTARELEKQARDLEYEVQDAEKEVEAFQQKTLSEVVQKVGPIIETIAKEKQLHLVIRSESGILAWGVDGLDISEEIVKRLNASKGAAPKK